MKRILFIICGFVIIAAATGCSYRSGYNVERESQSQLAYEGTVTFVRPEKFSTFGTESVRDYIRITHEEAVKNSAGFLKVSLGLRNIGGMRFYDRKTAPDFYLSVKTTCYDGPPHFSGQGGTPIYETNWQTIKMLRGATINYEAICPVKTASHYHITISEILEE
jgi:hypothetical protein